MPETTRLIDRKGEAHDVDEASLPGALAAGWTPESVQHEASRVQADVSRETYGGVAGGALAGAAGLARGATLGLSDAAIAGLGGEDASRTLAGLRNENPGISTAGSVIGAIAPALLTGGESAAAEAPSLLAASPSALAARLGSRIAAAGEGAGIVGRTLASGAGAATEGALQGAGGYISDVALGDRPLTADGFVGAMGQGALWGGVAGGALSLSGDALTAARKLFPASEMTADGARAARLAASTDIKSSLEDGAELTQAADSRLSDLSAQEEVANPSYKQRIDQIRIKAAQDVADAQVARAKAQQMTAESRAKAAADKAAAPGTKRALDFLNQFATPADEGAAVDISASTPTASRILDENSSAGIYARHDEGLSDLQREARTDYTSEGYKDINSELRSGAPLSKYTQRSVDGLDSMMTESETQPFKVFRGISDKQAGKLRVGDTLSDPGYTSTSTDEFVAANKFGGNGKNTLHIDVPPGQKFAPVGGTAGEYEILLPRGSNLKVHSVEEVPFSNGRLRSGDPKTRKVYHASIVGGPEESEDPDSLIAQLTGTKSSLDAGASLGDVSQVRPQEIQKAINSELAKVNPEAARIVSALDAAKASSQDMTEWLDKYGGAAGEEMSPLERQLAATKNALDAGNSIGDIGMAARRLGPTTPTGEDILASQSPPTQKIEQAIASKTDDFADDITKTAPLITGHESAHADLVDALGLSAPSSSSSRASGFRQAEQDSASKSQAQVAITADALAKKPSATGIASKLGDAGAAYEALRMMGVPLPDPKGIPVVGPLLSAYLKARVLGKAFGRFGGPISATAETVIASKAAIQRQTVYKAIDAALAGTSKVLKTAAPISGGPAAALGHVLFDAKSPQPQAAGWTSEPSKDSPDGMYLARASELAAAQQPGAIADSLKARINTSDPEMLQEAIATTTRKLQFLASVMPKPNDPPGAIDGRVWLPSKAALQNWSVLISAVDNPAATLQRAAAGQASASELNAVKQVYPALFADGQHRVIQQVSAGKIGDLTPAQKSMISRTWSLPLSSATQPDHGAWVQAGYAPKPTASPPQPSGQSGAPTISSPVNVGQRTLTRMDAGG